MSTTNSDRGAWGSRLGFILAAAGSAIGLGNIWRFPIETETHGGAAFVFVYLLCVLAIGVPVMIAELTVGRTTGSNPVGAFKRLAPKSLWKVVGALGVLTGMMILSAYAVVAGWILKYIWFSLTGALAGRTSDEIGAIFSAQSANGTQGLVLHLVFILLTTVVVAGGVHGGIEKASKWLMPVLLVLLVLLCLRSVTLPGASKGISFYLNPDFSKLNFAVIMGALGQAFFSLSLGMGAMITYGSYLSKKENLASAATIVCLMDTGIAILAGFMIFPALSSVGANAALGPALIFVVLPHIFNNIPLGQLFQALFFILVAIAALTSTISLLEVVVSYFIDEKRWSRKKAAWVMGGAAFVIGIPSTLSNGAVSSLTSFGFMNMVFTWFGEISLVVGALALCIFIAYKWGIRNALEEIRLGNPKFPMAAVWTFLIKFGCPLAIIAILLKAYILPAFSG